MSSISSDWEPYDLLPERLAVFAGGGHRLFANASWRADARLLTCPLLGAEDISQVAGAVQEGPCARMVASLRALAGGGGQPAEHECACQTADGEHRCFVRAVERRFRGERVIVVRHDDWYDRQQIEQALRRVIADREALLREVHHRVKNNLQIIFSLLALQLRTLDTDAARNALLETRMRVRAIATVHERLCDSADLARLEFGEYLKALVPGISSALMPQGTTVQLSVTAEPVRIGLDDAVRGGLVVNELVSNALRHAFAGRAAGRVEVDLRRVGQGQAELSVADDGVGLPRDIDPTTAETLGLQLAAGLARRLGGCLEVERGEGTRFRVMMRVESAAQLTHDLAR